VYRRSPYRGVDRIGRLDIRTRVDLELYQRTPLRLGKAKRSNKHKVIDGKAEDHLQKSFELFLAAHSVGYIVLRMSRLTRLDQLNGCSASILEQRTSDGTLSFCHFDIRTCFGVTVVQVDYKVCEMAHDLRWWWSI
jgi:hypothetical protein